LRRVLLPCLVGLVTVVPAIHWAQSVAVRLQHPASQNTTGNESDRAVVFHGANDVKHAANAEHRMHGEEWFSGQSSTGLGSFLRSPWENWKNFPVFILLWFLWFLVWFMPGFSIYALASERFGWRIRPHALIASQGSLVWLVPLTAIPVYWMGNGRSDFGPDTSMGILPAAHVLGYYALFFGFGVLYSECDDAAGRLGRCWRWTLPVALVLVFPLAVEFSSGVFGLRNHLAPPAYHRRLSIVLQSLYPWMMVFACTGVFRAMLARESRWIRYLSDASYWFYLTHLPLVILAQAAVRDYDFPAVIKFLLICSTVTAVLFLSYAKCVRYSFVGTFLNGSHSVPSLRKT
jgi:hypothetical protein